MIMIMRCPSCLLGSMLIPCSEPNSAPLNRPKSFGEKCPPAPGKPMPGKPKFGGGRACSMEAIVEAMEAAVVGIDDADSGGSG